MSINKFVLVLLCLSQSLYAKADITPVEQGGFFLLENLKTAPKNAEQASLAVPRIGDDFQCGAVILSEEGYVATAMHCLRDCIFDAKTKKPLLKIRQSIKKHYYSGYEIFPGENITCSLDFTLYNLTIFPSYRYYLGTPHVVWSGKGEHSHKELLVTDLSKQEFDSFKDLTEDIVILKYEDIHFYKNLLYNKEKTTKLPCLKIEEGVTTPGDPVWNIGYPLPNQRLSYKGRKSVYSLGSIRSSIEEDPIYKKYSTQIPANKRKLFWQREKEIWNRDHILLSTADAFSGNSGGAAVNAEGNLLGIVFGISKSSKTVYKGATTLSYKAKALRQRVRKDLGKNLADRIFNCTPTKTDIE